MTKKYYLLSLIICAIQIIGCSKISNNITIEQQVNNDMPDQICYNMEFAIFDSNLTKTIINSNRAKVYNDRKETILDSGVFVRFFNANGIQDGTLKSDTINIDDATKDMIAKGNVIVISDSSRTKLETTKLKWEQSSRQIYTDVYVRITSPTEIIEGIGLISDENLSNYKIFKVTGIKHQN
jgi:LPS export ABC transporter protein LptC